MISDSKIEEIKNKTNIVEVVSSFASKVTKAGKSHYTKCPKCGKEGKGKGLSMDANKNLAKCFSCDQGYNTFSYLKEVQNMTYPDSLKWLADFYNITIDEVKVSRKKKNIKSTYMYKQLKSSGLSLDDVKALVHKDEETAIEKSVFESGTRSQYGKIVDGDDMIIRYYNLEGKPVTYIPKNSKSERELYRIRWQVPEQHPDKNGKAIKYQSPKDSGSHLYIPELLRQMYANNRKFKTLYIQEGEKKAEKATKHGMPSVGIMGIQNLVYNKNLPQEMQMIIKSCDVKEVIFVLDNDWDHLSHKLEDGHQVDQRPRNFFYAVKNFKEFFLTYQSIGLYLELFFAHINTNEKDDKGIDDILANTLKGKEKDFLDDLNEAKISNTGIGEYITVHKITSLADSKLMEFWSLNKAETFASKYKDQLIELREFKISKHKWRFDDNKTLVLAMPLLPDEQFWEKETNFSRGRDVTTYRFRYKKTFTFLQRRGFNRMKISKSPTPGMEEKKNFHFVHIENKIVRTVDSYFIRDFAIELADEITPWDENDDVMDMLYRGGKMYYGPDNMSNLKYIEPVFAKNTHDSQMLLFKENYWRITAKKIEEKSITTIEDHIWAEKINNFSAKLLKDPLVQFTKISPELIKQHPDKKGLNDFIGQYFVDFSKEGEKCHALKFLFNTGNFFWRKDEEELTPEERFETNLHLLNKLTAFGYLIHQFFDPANAKAIIGMDGKNSEVGSSNGGSGKSLFGDFIGQVVPQVTISGKAKNLTDDPFWLEEVDERTDNVFIDDVRQNFDFEPLFPSVTGKCTINKKGQGKFTIPKQLTPKFYIPTNHALMGEGSSYRRRQHFISFSDLYNDDHTPMDDFNIRFFDEWDEYQYNLYYNLCALAVQLYLKHGLVNGPTERLEQRRLRQAIGEAFLGWADEYYGYDDVQKEFLRDNNNVNERQSRIMLYKDEFLAKNKEQSKYVPAHRFKDKFKKYCKYRGAKFNPHKFYNEAETMSGADDKSGGVEYFTLADKNYSS